MAAKERVEKHRLEGSAAELAVEPDVSYWNPLHEIFQKHKAWQSLPEPKLQVSFRSPACAPARARGTLSKSILPDGIFKMNL